MIPHNRHELSTLLRSPATFYLVVFGDCKEILRVVESCGALWIVEVSSCLLRVETCLGPGSSFEGFGGQVVEREGFSSHFCHKVAISLGAITTLEVPKWYQIFIVGCLTT